MLGWLRGHGRVVHTVAPPEMGIHASAFHDREEEIREVDVRLVKAAARRDRLAIDRLLDLRNSIRPARPAEPGAPS